MTILTLHEFIEHALYSPSGYYMNGSPIGGKNGDFITAPEMTQVFGEVLALWAIDQWMQMGEPSELQLIELGAGQGTLMVDFLRTARIIPKFMQAVTVHLVEISPSLRVLQAERLTDYPVHWHSDVSDVPPGPSIILANEFFDALPIDQYIFEEGWRQRSVTFENNQWQWTSRPADLDGSVVTGAIREICPWATTIIQTIITRGADPCSVLIIDYGYDDALATGDTLQALRRHQHCDPLSDPGTADITHHVNFGELVHLFQQAHWRVTGPISQGEFLTSLGLIERTEQLAQKATPEQAGLLRTAAVRLIHPAQMGALFRVLQVSSFIAKE